MTSGNLNISLSNDTAHNKLPGERVKYDRYENFNGITGMLTFIQPIVSIIKTLLLIKTGH